LIVPSPGLPDAPWHAGSRPAIPRAWWEAHCAGGVAASCEASERWRFGTSRGRVPALREEGVLDAAIPEAFATDLLWHAAWRAAHAHIEAPPARDDHARAAARLLPEEAEMLAAARAALADWPPFFDPAVAAAVEASAVALRGALPKAFPDTSLRRALQALEDVRRLSRPGGLSRTLPPETLSAVGVADRGGGRAWWARCPPERQSAA